MTIYTKESIKELVSKSDKAVERAILAIYALQTLDEQHSEETKHQNGVGFSGADANILSSFAEQIKAKNGRGIEYGKCLSSKQMELARKKMLRYARQLMEIANGSLSIKAQEEKSEAQKLEEYLQEHGAKGLRTYDDFTQKWHLSPTLSISLFVECISRGDGKQIFTFQDEDVIEYQVVGEIHPPLIFSYIPE